MTNEAEILFKEIANGDDDAYIFICLWSSYCHHFDDIVDRAKTADAGNLVECDNLLVRLLTCKFYERHKVIILTLRLLIGETYVASEYLRSDTGDIRRFNWGLFLSHTGNDMLRFVALVTGGESHLVYISQKLRELTLKEHYNE